MCQNVKHVAEILLSLQAFVDELGFLMPLSVPRRSFVCTFDVLLVQADRRIASVASKLCIRLATGIRVAPRILVDCAWPASI